MGRQHRSDAVPLHRNPEQVADVRRRLARSRLHARRSEAVGGLVSAQRRRQGLALEIVELPGRTPVLFGEIAGTSPDAPTVLLYGHYDKQPEFTGWHDGLGPWTPVIRDGRLYRPRRRRRRLRDVREPHRDRGAAARRRAAAALRAADRRMRRERQLRPARRISITSRRASARRDLVVCLDAECGDYEHLWLSSSLRGLLLGTLEVSVLTEGVHSGAASGIVPSSFRILRTLLDRIEDATVRPHDRRAARADRRADARRRASSWSSRSAT